MDLGIAGRTALVNGGSAGMGHGAALALARTQPFARRFVNSGRLSLPFRASGPPTPASGLMTIPTLRHAPETPGNVFIVRYTLRRKVRDAHGEAVYIDLKERRELTAESFRQAVAADGRRGETWPTWR